MEHVVPDYVHSRFMNAITQLTTFIIHSFAILYPYLCLSVAFIVPWNDKLIAHPTRYIDRKAYALAIQSN